MRGMQISSDHPLLLRIVDDLAEHGWSQQNIFLPLDLTQALAAECRKRAAEGELAPAAVGRGRNSTRSSSIPTAPTMTAERTTLNRNGRSSRDIAVTVR